MEFHLIDGEEMVADGSYIPANVSRNSWIDIEEEVTQSMQSYLDCLDEYSCAGVPLFRRNGNRHSGTGIPHLIETFCEFTRLKLDLNHIPPA